jgi:sugar phosphate isomerase/epimerase
MNRLKLGIVLEATGLPLRRALHAASELAVSGVRADAAGDLAPDRLTETGRRAFGNLLRTHNLGLSALNCPLRSGLDTNEDAQQRVDHVRGVMRLASDLDCRVVTVPLPKLPGDSEGSRAVTLREALQALGAFGDRTGTRLALRVGGDPGDAVRSYLEAFDTGSLQVDFDPASFLLAGADPLAGLMSLAGRVAHAHARDARTAAGTGGREVPVGTGDVDWAAYVAALDAVGYQGYLVVEREHGAERFADVAAGVRFLRRFVPDDRPAARRE